jgi:hypothetical protein
MTSECEKSESVGSGGYIDIKITTARGFKAGPTRGTTPPSEISKNEQWSTIPITIQPREQPPTASTSQHERPQVEEAHAVHCPSGKKKMMELFNDATLVL